MRESDTVDFNDKCQKFKNWPFPVAGKIKASTKKMVGEPIRAAEVPKKSFFDEKIDTAIENILKALSK